MPITKPKKVIDPQAAAIRRALALEGQVINPDQYGLPAAQTGLDTATGGYRAKYLAGLSLPDQTRTAAEAVAPDLKMTRAGLEGAYAGSVDPNNPNYVDPSNILQFVQGRFQGGRDYLSRVTDAASRLWDKGTQSARFAVEDATTGLNRAQTKYGDAQSRARALLDEQRQRGQGLTDYEKKAQIDLKYAKPSGGDSITLEDTLKNPTLGMFAVGISRVAKPDGGYDFFDKGGKPITVEQAQAMVPGSTIPDLLEGSSYPKDVTRINPLTASQGKDQSTFNFYADQIRKNPKNKKGVLAQAKKDGYVYLISDLTQL